MGVVSQVPLGHETFVSNAYNLGNGAMIAVGLAEDAGDISYTETSMNYLDSGTSWKSATVPI